MNIYHFGDIMFPASTKSGGMTLAYPDVCTIPNLPGPVPISYNELMSTSMSSSKATIEKKTESKSKGSSTIPKKSMSAAFFTFDEPSSSIGGGIKPRRSGMSTDFEGDFGLDSNIPGSSELYKNISQDDDSGLDPEWMDNPFERDNFDIRMQFLALQNAVQMESRKFQTLSNASKARHDIAMSSIRNIKA